MPRFRSICALALVASLALAAPAEAALVYTKDGRTLDGALKVEAAGLVVTSADGKAVSVPYEQIVGVSMDNEPIFPRPRRVEQGLLGNDAVAGLAIAANVAACLAAGYAIYRGMNQAQAPATTR